MFRWRSKAVTVLALSAAPVHLSAQCPATAQIGHLGITQLECDCVMGAPARGTQWRFTTEPVVRRIERGSAADGRLRVGDVIVSVDGQPVTTSAGANLLARPPRDRNVVLQVRRDGRLATYTLRPGSVCDTDPRLLGVMAPVAAPRVAPAAAAAAARTAVAPAQPTPAQSPPVWIGIAFSCGDCSHQRTSAGSSWTFRSPPEVYSVEPGSPAYEAGLRRGDVLTHVDGAPITTPEGARRWAALDPGSQVRLQYRRGQTTRTTTVRVGQRTPAYAVTATGAAVQAPDLTQTLARRDSAMMQLLREQEQALARQRSERERLLRQLQEAPRSERDRAALEARVRAHLQELERESSRQEQQLRELVEQRLAEQARSEARVRVAPVAAAQAGTQRYSGTFGGVDVEVRGGGPVIVSEDGDELVIRMPDGSTVRLRRPVRR